MEYLNEIGFHHPRTAKEHSTELSRHMVNDLYQSCPSVRSDADEGTIAFDLDVKIKVGDRSHVTDLVIGEPVTHGLPSHGLAQSELHPSKYRIAIEHKSVITAHRNRLNRLRDLNEFAEYMYAYRADVVVGGTLLIGTSTKFVSVESIDRIIRAWKALEKMPILTESRLAKCRAAWLRDMGQLTNLENWKKRMCKKDPLLLTVFGDTKAWTTNEVDDAENTFRKFQSGLRVRDSNSNPPEKPGFDGFALMYVAIDNFNPCQIDGSREAGRNDLLTYSQFLRRIETAYSSRFT